MNAALEACQTIGSTIVTAIVNAGSSAIGSVIANPIKSLCCVGGLMYLKGFYNNISKNQVLIGDMILERNMQSNNKKTEMGYCKINNSYGKTMTLGTDAYCVDNARILKNGRELPSKELEKMMQAASVAKCVIVGLKALCCYGLYTIFAK